MIRAILAYLSPWAVKASQEYIDEIVDEICRLPTKAILIGCARVLTEPRGVSLKVRTAFVTSILLTLAERERA